MTRPDGARVAMLDLLQRWCATPSGSDDAAGLDAMRLLIHERLRFLPGATEDLPVEGAAAPVISRRCRPSAPTQVLLVGHYDTVYGPEDPFRETTRVDEDTVRGPGVVDMKGGILVMLRALELLEDHPGADGLGWRVWLAPDEELGSPWSVPALVSAAESADVALVFEPSAAAGDLVRRRPGRHLVEVSVVGRAAHAGRDLSNGRSAAIALAETTLAAHALGAASPGVALNVGLIHAGGPANVVPALGRALVDVRSGDGEVLDRALEGLRESAAGLARRHEVQIDAQSVVHHAPLGVTPAREALFGAYAEGAVELGIDIGWQDVGGISDANHLAAAGLPVLDGLGACGGELHSPREWVRVSSLSERAEAAGRLLSRLATEGGALAV